MAPCSQTLQNLSGIHHGAPAGTLHPLCQCRHRGFMSLCLVWIFVYSKVPVLPPDPLSGCNLNLISLPTIQHRRLSLGLFFFKLKPSFFPCPAWPGLAWLGDAPTLSHYKGGCMKQSTGQSHATVSGHYEMPVLE